MEGTTEHDGYDRVPTRPLTANGSSLQARLSVTGARSSSIKGGKFVPEVQTPPSVTGTRSWAQFKS
jgi:hypothetical protein